jgi:hypothetical protein
MTSPTDVDRQCPGCGGTFAYDPDVAQLRCGACDTQAPIPPPRGPGPRELRLADGLSRSPRGYGTATIRLSCGSCGAVVDTAAETRATRCPYCASPSFTEVPADPDAPQPESLAPFTVSKKKAGRGFSEWLGGLWLRPGDLVGQAAVEGVAGAYLPFWTFDADVESDWDAERGDHYTTTEDYVAHEGGKKVNRTRTVTHTRWRPASGRRRDHHDDVLVWGSKGVREEIGQGTVAFDTKNLVPYHPAYLLGWQAEAAAVPLSDAWEIAKGRVESDQESKCKGDVGGDEVRNLHVRNDFSNETFKLVLLPVYVLAWRYRGRTRQVLVDGRSGAVHGDAPYSVAKVLAIVVPVNLFVLAVAIVLLPLLLVVLPAMLFEAWWLWRNWDRWFS